MQSDPSCSFTKTLVPPSIIINALAYLVQRCRFICKTAEFCSTDIGENNIRAAWMIRTKRISSTLIMRSFQNARSHIKYTKKLSPNNNIFYCDVYIITHDQWPIKWSLNGPCLKFCTGTLAKFCSWFFSIFTIHSHEQKNKKSHIVNCDIVYRYVFYGFDDCTRTLWIHHCI